jgi:hypothetical protein
MVNLPVAVPVEALPVMGCPFPIVIESTMASTVPPVKSTTPEHDDPMAAVAEELSPMLNVVTREFVFPRRYNDGVGLVKAGLKIKEPPDLWLPITMVSAAMLLLMPKFRTLPTSGLLPVSPTSMDGAVLVPPTNAVILFVLAKNNFP